MKLIITQPEIEAIVRAHVESTVQLREGAEMKIDFTATRSDDGITATIDIPYLGVAGIPAIADAIAAKDASAPAPANAPKPRAARAAAASGKPAQGTNAGSLLGAGTTAATDAPANPEPVKDEVADAAAAGDDATTVEADDAAPFEPTPAPAAEEAAPAPAAQQGTTRGPSLFGNSAFKL